MIDEKALTEAAKKLRKLRLTDVGGRKEHPADTVKSVFQRGLGGLYDDESIVYTLRHGIKYYLESLCVCQKYDHAEFTGGWVCPVHGIKYRGEPYRFNCQTNCPGETIPPMFAHRIVQIIKARSDMAVRTLKETP